ncbi:MULTISPECIES: HAD-IA family hydrolase [unclassified Colwellia]|uniref:HAD-IA family hydrolase n=1 Tax=unclassified Colwellia TaxID=196834 RepID=UPI0015F56B9B|nr:MULTISPECIES: HAD-IA family hydrolase [unclassified Colwellia]MBA6363081.1 HAD-IA family hydrolase [Colwellia sp. BRX8-8]MBA6347837.1 HAD-IA family hydrolase [Colwellia sp. BRX8-9]MBA6351830.1 HAD-IA family hydrolase [Colwellia sp. BRX9-1]MBA6370054.1 HAD-IA family hydrolase [Colwellia sp. BRX8-4]MBA6378582.1 HAD-IA family hydrolase [Colwellia sp. BRX10-7]
MKFYRRLAPFQAISFDLDDTLYSNYPVMMATDAKMVAYFSALFSLQIIATHATKNTLFDYRFWSPFREQAIAANPQLIHHVGDIRLATYTLGMKALGLADDIASDQAQKALDYFVQQRSDFVVPEAVHQLLQSLQKKYPLVAISNGNVDTDKIGISAYFSYRFHAGDLSTTALNKNQRLRQKPAADMFVEACEKLIIKPSQLLHVGDCGRSDILGAIDAGCQTAWISCYDVGKPLTVLPNIELADISELCHLL